jgi:hypothetical protein
MPTNSTNSTIPDWLLRWDSRVELPYGGEVWRPLLSLLTNSHDARIRLLQIESHISKRLRELLRTKISTFSKFSYCLTSIDDLNASVSTDAVVTIWNGQSGEDLNEKFKAMGERFVLYLAITSAVREALRVGTPFVTEIDFVDDLDPTLSTTCQQLVEELGMCRNNTT